MPQPKKAQNHSANSLSRIIDVSIPAPRSWRCRTLGDGSHPARSWLLAPAAEAFPAVPETETPPSPQPTPRPEEIDPLYLLSCHFEWEQYEEPSAAWELIAASQSSHSDTRAHARALLAASRHFGGSGLGAGGESAPLAKRRSSAEDEMKAPYGLEIIDNCAECIGVNSGFFCELSRTTLEALNQVSHRSTLPTGAILFVEGQAPRGLFIVCSGKVNHSKTSKEGKTLILKTSAAGEILGLSAAISGANYETTAETATPCTLNFIERKRFLELLQNHSEIGLHTAVCLSRDYQSAYQDIHDLVLSRSSSGKLARLLLSQARGAEDEETCATMLMTHEEMALRIGASRETVTRLLTRLRKKQLIRLDGPKLIIRNRTALKALAV